MDLRGPDGDRVDLTGTWRVPNGGPFYYLYQAGDCLWYVGPFLTDGEEGPIGFYTLSFEGRITPDFEVTGTAAVSRVVANSFTTPVHWTKSWVITFQGSGATSGAVLVSDPDPYGTYSSTRLERVTEGGETP